MRHSVANEVRRSAQASSHARMSTKGLVEVLVELDQVQFVAGPLSFSITQPTLESSCHANDSGRRAIASDPAATSHPAAYQRSCLLADGNVGGAGQRGAGSAGEEPQVRRGGDQDPRRAQTGTGD